MVESVGRLALSVWYKSSHSQSEAACVEVMVFGWEDPARPVSSAERSGWHKSSFSGSQGDCVEVAESVGGASIRDSKSPHLGHLSFSVGEWGKLLALVRGDTLH